MNPIFFYDFLIARPYRSGPRADTSVRRRQYLAGDAPARRIWGHRRRVVDKRGV